LSYVDWFNKTVCGDPSAPYGGYVLTLRDVLSWARFVVESREANNDLALWEAYCHGACLMHLDGLGLGAGLPVEDSSSLKRRGETFLLDQVPEGITIANLDGAEERFGTRCGGTFGAFPFFIPVGPLTTPETHFNLGAPTTAQNMFRVLRAMQLRKPVLLEGSPGVGKTR
jgi:midasin